jgi:hypothetical protein
VNGERRQERGDLGGAHLGRVALAVKEDVPLDPVDVRLLGSTAVVAGADGLAHAVEKPGLLGLPRGLTNGEQRSWLAVSRY